MPILVGSRERRHDPRMPPRANQHVTLPNARIRLLEGTHFIAAENPDAFNQCVASFLEQTQGGELAQIEPSLGQPESRKAGEGKDPSGGGAGTFDSERRGVPRGV